MKIAIIGSGNSGCAHAAKLIEYGHSVNLVKTSDCIHSDNFERICKAGYIECIDSTNDNKEFRAYPNLITRNIELGIKDVDVVMVLTQSLQHRLLAPRIAPLLKSGQIVFIIPGNMGSAVFKKYTSCKDIVFVEAESTPYDARICAPGVVNILFRNVRNAISFLEKENEKYLPLIDSLFGAHKYLRTNIIESSMHNPNMIVHTVGSIMSASRIEQAHGEFWMYREAFSPAIWNVINKLDAEKNTIIKTFGGKNPQSYLDACKWRNEEDLSIDSLEVFKTYAATGGPKGPDNIETRFIYEDVPMGLCLLENLGKLASVETPIASALITIASAILQTDFRTVAYSCDDLCLYLKFCGISNDFV